MHRERCERGPKTVACHACCNRATSVVQMRFEATPPGRNQVFSNLTCGLGHPELCLRAVIQAP
jgi:hypothetical protein